MNRLILQRKRALIQHRKKLLQQKRKRALIKQIKKQKQKHNHLQLKNKKNNVYNINDDINDDINDNIKKINAIFVQSFYKEILTNQLQNFIENILLNNINSEIPIYVFLDIKSKKFINRLNNHNNRINYIYIDDKNVKNSISYIFYKMMNFKVDNYTNVLLLECDCKLLYNFINVLNNDIKNKNYWIYGSHYYGKRNISNRKHMNGVAIYNRKKVFLNFINKIFINKNFINKKNNYDALLSNKISKNNKKMLYNSNYILNICTPDDIKLDYKNFKKNAVIIHQKDNNKYNRHTFKKLNMNQLLIIK